MLNMEVISREVQFVYHHIPSIHPSTHPNQPTLTITAILKKYNFLTFENFLFMANVCLLYRIFHGLAPPPFNQFVVNRNTSIRTTRASTRGDCCVQFRSTKFSQTAFTVKAAAGLWNTLPADIKGCCNF